MASVRCLLLTLVGSLVLVTQAVAQSPGTIRGRVIDSLAQQPVPGVSVVIEGSQRGTHTRDDGTFTIAGVPSGSYRVRAARIGYVPQTQTATVTAGGTVELTFVLAARSAVLQEVVVTGYGTQRREAITGSVATVDAEQANKGVIANPNQLVVGRVAGVQTTTNSGEPGAGMQIRIRGGTSISASNDPLYVVDGVPLQNENTTPDAAGVGSINAALPRSPLNTINPNDIESITVLKDASATAIYGSRGANGVVLIQTKRGVSGAGTTEYETYVGASMPSNRLHFATGEEYRQFVKARVATGDLPASAEQALGAANTDWEKELMRTGIATNHNLAFSGGSQTTQYRASLNYFDQQGVVINNGLRRYQGRLNATHDAIGGRVRLGLNLMASRVNNSFAPIENGGGFLGGLFTNMAIFNPTYPVTRADGTFYEVGSGAQDVRNPVGMVRQLQDEAPENRVLGNLTGSLTLLPNLVAQTTLGTDYTNSVRRTFAPKASPVGAQYSGFARQGERSLQNLNFQQLLTFTPKLGRNELEVVGGYEYTKFDNEGFEARMQGFITDAFGVDNLAAGTQSQSPVPFSYHVESQLVSFFGRANYGFAGRYFLTGVVRYDGSSRLAPGHQWATFPAVSASWRISEEEFMGGRPFGLSTLALRVGWGKQGNQAVAPYQTQLLLRADPGATYPFGGQLTTGLRAAQVGNPNLKWETAQQTNVGVDYGFANDRFTGSVEYYQKDTKDLLLDVSVPQPAVVSSRIENIGSLQNRGVEATLDARLWERAQRSLTGGLVATIERNKVESLGGNREFILTGGVFGQGQSGQYSQRIMVGEPIGTFFGPRFLGVNAQGQQEFACVAAADRTDCVNGRTTDPREADKAIIGHANPDFSLGLRNNLTWGKFDASWLWRGEFGRQVFNNTALVYQTIGNAKQGRNFLRDALDMPDAISEPSKFSSRWVEDAQFVRLQNATVGYTFNLPGTIFGGRSTRVYVSGDNLLLFTPYSGYDPEVFVSSGLASRGIDYLTYPRARTYTLGARFQF